MIEDKFLSFSSEKLTQLGGRIEDCLGRLTEDQIWLRRSPNENAIGNLVLHLCGNVRQWILGGVGGEADSRDRDSEFAARELPPAELSRRLTSVVARASEIIRDLPHDRLLEPKTIQNYQVTVMEAIYHVVEHFGQHTAQIIFATKLLTGHDLGYYKHLSGPKHSEAVP